MGQERGTRMHFWLWPSLLLQYLGIFRSQRLRPSELEKAKNKKLRAIVKHSYDFVPYYRRLLRQTELKPSDIKTTFDLRKIPISKKEDIKDLGLDQTIAKNRNMSNCFRWRTSGTSGVTFTTYWDRKAMLMQYVENYLMQMNCGNKISARQMVIGADWIPTHPIQKAGIFRTKRISPFEKLSTQIQQIKDFGPKALTAYSSCAGELAKEVREESVQEVKLDLVFTGGENLDQHTRELIEDTFEAKVFDSYGANEVGGAGTECTKHEGYHIWADSVIVEILRDNEPASFGEDGDITITNLTNYAMPFIRYNLEDQGRLLPDLCSCGSSFPLMKISQGRKSDVIHLRGERAVSALAVCGRFPSIIGIRQFQLIQNGLERFTVKITKGREFTDEVSRQIERKLRSILGDVRINVVVVESIPRERTGKFKQFISKI